ncbi:MAG: HAD-IC family P-type ATPase [Oscillospiraceae bacterium]|nr:HAD-IC family P-type ATPase [Oscillospiraceae bacterium]
MLSDKIKRFTPSCETGLTSEQIEEHKKQGAVNVVTKSNSVTVKGIICRNVFTYFNLIFAVLAALLILVRAYHGLSFMPIIIINTLIGIIQQIRSKRTLDKLNMLHAPHATLIRSGIQIEVSTEEAVLDDIAVFSAGNQIYADAVVEDGEVNVNESLLTGEADEILKKPGDMLMSGSFIVSGSCRARLDAVGDDSYIAKLSAKAKQTDAREHSKLMASLNLLIKIVGIVIIPMGIIMFCQQYFIEHLSAQDCVSAMVAALLGMIPEGLYLLSSVALALSVMNLSRRNVLVHDMACVETLARVNILCVDKTGTITENTMEVIRSEALNGTDIEELKLTLGSFAAAMTDDNSTMRAIKKVFKKTDNRTANAVTAFSSAVKYSSAVLGGTPYVLGAPELVLREDYINYRDKIELYAAQGFRVVVLCESPVPADGTPLTMPVKPMGLVLLRNPIRENAPATFRYFKEQGVEIKVISGDNPVTVSSVALDAGIDGAEKHIDVSALELDELKKIAKNTVVFGRVTPEKKLALIEALREDGNTVAMTGDGVNDVLALKEADCSVAMASGSEAAQNVSQMVLLDSDFSGMPDIVLEGRRVINNLERSAGLFLRKNIYSLLLALFTMIAVFKYPLEPQQATLINAFTIGMPAFLLALEANKSIIKGNFLSNVILKALPAALANFITLSSLLEYGSMHRINNDTLTMIATLVLGISGIVVLFSICRPLSFYRGAVLIASALGFALFSYVLRDYFSFVPLTFEIIKLTMIFSLIVTALFVMFSIIMICIREAVKKRRKTR